MSQSEKPTKLRLLLLTFAVTIFTSASLLFVVQPMVGKMILPHLGGSPSVWTTCMLFFQTTLVAGYLYAHVIAQKMSPRWQIGVHFALIAAAVVTSLPFDIPEQFLQSQSSPALWLLFALLIAIGLPLLVVSSSAPLFQHWFAFTDHPDADDPYYLYAASNVGSMLALFGYPFFVERTFGLDVQSNLWAWGFGLLALLAAGCSAFVFNHQTEAPAKDTDDAEPEATPATSGELPYEGRAGREEDEVTWKRRGWWLLITFIPSSLMLGVTQYLTTDIASAPFLWVLPLGLYLLTFIIVFARLDIYLWLYRVAIPFFALLVLGATYAEFFSITVTVAIHLWMFFLFAIYFHGMLAKDRPSTDHLTEFYIWMSVGGALGGLFNALVAPALFDWMLEYYLILAVGIAVIRPRRADDGHASVLADWGAAIALAFTIGFYFWSVALLIFDTPGTMFGTLVVIGVAVGMSVKFPALQNVGLAVILLVGFANYEHIDTAMTYERSFFANYTVYKDRVEDHKVRVFSHGTTQHGMQAREERLQQVPLGYHHPRGPMGDVLHTIPHERIAIAGLGVGAMGAYAQKGKEVVFFEIDPVVEKMARKYFTYLEECGDRCEVRIGDARKLLEEAEPHSFDVIMMDAYNSDSVPTHLLTREALKLYLSRLTEDGVVVFHVSNRYLNVESVVGALVEDMNLPARTKSFTPSEREAEALAYASTYVVVAREESDLREIAHSSEWDDPEAADVVWTDNFSNIISVFKWN